MVQYGTFEMISNVILNFQVIVITINWSRRQFYEEVL